MCTVTIKGWEPGVRGLGRLGRKTYKSTGDNNTGKTVLGFLRNAQSKIWSGTMAWVEGV